MRRRRTAAALVGLALVAVVTGCTTLPTYGPVHTRADSASSTDTAVTYFVPPGPGAGDDPQTIVRGFLLAMQANPPGTAVAREFLTDRARTTWRPVVGTVVYDTTTIAGSGSQVEVALHGVHTLDGRGP